jgi:hypothetical protein
MGFFDQVMALFPTVQGQALTVAALTGEVSYIESWVRSWWKSTV